METIKVGSTALDEIREHAAAIREGVDTLLATRSVGGTVHIKSLTDATATLCGYGVVFGGRDLVGDTFTPATDYGLSREARGMPVYYDHELHPTLKGQIGNVLAIRQDDEGLFFELELERSEKYVDEVLRLVEAGKVGLSTGALSHLVQKDTKSISRWVVGEVSLTVTPAEPRTIGIQMETKAMYETTSGTIEANEEEEEETPEEEEATTEKDAMAVRMTQMEARIKEMTDAIERSPALKTAGYVNDGYVVGGTKNNAIRTFGNWLVAVVRDDAKTLKSYATKDGMTNTTGEAGGYLVPSTFIADIMRATAEATIVRPRAMPVPLPCDIPALDQYSTSTPANGLSHYFGGMQWSWGDADETIGETTGEFYNVHMDEIELKGVTKIANSMLRKVSGLETYLTRLISEGVGYAEDYAYLRGSGVGEPLGVYNSDALATYSVGTFAMEDVEGMVGKLVQGSGANAVFVCNQHLRGDLAGLVTYVQGIGQSLVTGTLAGLPLIFSDKLPATLATGGLLLADFSKYLVGPMNAIEIVFDNNAYFGTNKAGLRIVCYTNGTPWMRGKIKTDATPNYVSAFIATTT